MGKKGFTLMELLAIISTIAIPIFLKAINKSKTTSIERRADLYIEAVEVTIATENLDGNFNPEECVVQGNGNIKCDDDKVLEVEDNYIVNGIVAHNATCIGGTSNDMPFVNGPV